MVLRITSFALFLAGVAAPVHADADPVAYLLIYPQSTVELGAQSSCRTITNITSNTIVHIPMDDKARNAFLGGGYDPVLSIKGCEKTDDRPLSVTRAIWSPNGITFDVATNAGCKRVSGVPADGAVQLPEYYASFAHFIRDLYPQAKVSSCDPA